MASLFTLYKNAINALVSYAEVDLGSGSDGTPRRLPRSAPSDEAGASLFVPANPGHVTLDAQGAGLATDAKLELIRALLAAPLGVSAQSLPLPTGAATQATLDAVRALLAGTLGISAAALPLPAGAATDAKLEAVRALLAAPSLPTGAATQTTLEALRALVAGTLTVSVANEIEIKNDAGSPVPVMARNGMVKTMTVVTLPAYAAGGTVVTTAQDGTSTNATVAANTAVTLLPANTSRRNFRIMNIGTGIAHYGYASAVAPSKGWPVASASTVGDQGGGDEDTAPSTGAIYGVSSAGTTLVIIEG